MGDDVPPLGHWLFFLPDVRQSDIGGRRASEARRFPAAGA